MYLIYAFYLFIYLVHKSKSKISRHLKTDYEKKKKNSYIFTLQKLLQNHAP